MHAPDKLDDRYLKNPSQSDPRMIATSSRFDLILDGARLTAHRRLIVELIIRRNGAQRTACRRKSHVDGPGLRVAHAVRDCALSIEIDHDLRGLSRRRRDIA